MSRIKLSNVVSRQLPEHIREDYPTFVAFVEAYYEYLQNQGVDFTTVRDIDTTLDSFITQFKKELAYNLPNIDVDERFLLQNIKDQYLAKGSESSYKLLFKLLFGKDVELIYPGSSMLRASDGRWKQEISVFAKVDYGSPEVVVGRLAEIQTANRILRANAGSTQDIIAEVDRIVLVDPVSNIYEFFLDNRFYGTISPQDKIRYGDTFQATILPTTQKLTINQPGKNFRVGQVFELKSGTGSGTLVKITAVTEDGGIKYAEIIKFGIGYNANFAITLLSTNSVTSLGNSTTTSSSTLVQQNTYDAVTTGAVTVDPNPVSAGLFVVGNKYQISSVGSTNWLSIGAGWEPSLNLKQGSKYIIQSVGTTNWVSLGAASNTVGLTFVSNANGASGTGYATPDGFSASIGTQFIARGVGSGSGSAVSLTIVGSATSFGATDNVKVGEQIYTTSGLLIGIVESIQDSTHLRLESSYSDYRDAIFQPYNGAYTFRNTRNIGSLFLPYGFQAYSFDSSLTDRTQGFDEQGYVNQADWVSYDFVDGTYAGTLLREFSLEFRNAQTQSADPAIMNISLGALVKYPGYFQTNSGFLDDSIFIQDSKYYQVFSYVLKIDERLSSYSSAVKTMLHPAGMALFGEFNITNNYDLAISLQSLVNSLGVSLQTTQEIADRGLSLRSIKSLSSSLNTPIDNSINFSSRKLFSDSSQVSQQFNKSFNKLQLENVSTEDNVTIGLEFVRQFNEPLITGESVGKRSFKTFTENTTSTDSINLSYVSKRNVEEEVYSEDILLSLDWTGRLTDLVLSNDQIQISSASTTFLSSDYSGITDSISFVRDYRRSFQTDQNIYSVINSIKTTKYTTDILQPQTESGYLAKNSYAGQDFFASEYSVGSRESTFTTP